MKLSEELKACRHDMPSGFNMDCFINSSIKMEGDIEVLRRFAELALVYSNMDSTKLLLFAKKLGIVNENGSPSKLLDGDI